MAMRSAIFFMFTFTFAHQFVGDSGIRHFSTPENKHFSPIVRPVMSKRHS
ncbi:hypothetical protein BBR47_07460 [Brevibacillus brevis NBRC 100599]|uniref:Uncharacterized protein n=1 Tax=Brevibacillus brevis (strain 47 / JCM 6285 / NBRC 100599) TaxID=358681 RepID=C0Z4J6_BREBN|nr:hypothetical protein BBR47_07460 [Brevibacillus brevis NBRC 100599]